MLIDIHVPPPTHPQEAWLTVIQWVSFIGIRIWVHKLYFMEEIEVLIDIQACDPLKSWVLNIDGVGSMYMEVCVCR